MPAWWQLTPAEVAEDQGLPENDPVNAVIDPAHPLWLEEQEWAGGIPGQIYHIFTSLAGERDLGYMETAPRWAEEPAEDVRDWGIWAFHGVRTYEGYED